MSGIASSTVASTVSATMRPAVGAGSGGGTPPVPEGAMAVWDVANYSDTPVPHIPPVGSTATIDGNYLRTGIRLSTVNVTSGTATANYANGWDGSASRAMRLLASPGVWDFRLQAFGSALHLAAGTYTLSFYCKSNTGSDQPFLCGIQSSYPGLEARTATSSWAKVEVSITLASLATNRVAWLAVPVSSGVDPLDILIDDVRVDAGGASAATPVDSGIIYLGRQPQGATIPTVTSGAVALATGKPLSAHFAAATTFSNVTMAVYLKKTAASAAAAGLMSKWGATYAHASIQEITGALYGTAGQSTVSNESVINPMCSITNDGWHLVTFTRDDTYVWLYLDDVPIGRQAHTGNTAAQVRDWIFNDLAAITNNLFFGGSVSCWGLWNRALSQLEVVQLREYCKAQRVSNGDTVAAVNNVVCYVGDSISAVRSYAFAYPTKITTSEKCYGFIPARAGYRLSDIQNAAFIAWVDSAIATPTSDAARLGILTSLIGANGVNTLTAPQVVTWIADYLAWGQARRAAGWLWAPATILPINGLVGHNTNRATINTAIRSWEGLGFCDATIDVAGDSTIGDDDDAANATYYSDGTHPTNAGHTIIAPYFEAAINSLL